MAAAKTKAPATVGSRCPDCHRGMVVRVGRKSTVRTVTCKDCGRRWSYSAWLLRTLPNDGGFVHQVDLVPAPSAEAEVAYLRAAGKAVL